MIDCHQHIRAEDLTTPEKRNEYAEWLRGEMECVGIERFALMPYPKEDLDGTVERNKNTAKLLEEHPDLGYAWVYIDPNWGEGAVEEFRRAVQADGFVGLKHHSNRFHHPLSDPVVDPMYTKWEQDLDECVERGAKAVKMLPLYHGYDLHEELTRDLMRAAAERDLPVIVCSVLEDLRKQHPTHKPRRSDEMFRDRWNEDQVDAIIDLLKECPETDVILDNCWSSAPRILEETRSCVDRHWVRNSTHDGELLFNIDGLFIYYETQAADAAAAEVGIDHLVFSAQLPFNVVQAYYNYVEYLPVDEAEKDRVRAENILDLVE